MYKLYSNSVFVVKKLLGKLSSSNDFKCQSIHQKLGASLSQSEQLWYSFIEHSRIANINFYGNLYAGYLADASTWVLSSWIWTNAASIRCFCKQGKINEAISFCDVLINQQQECGGWIVRNDYDRQGTIPMLAPNDSAYIANNAFVELYISTMDQKYLEIAKRCADWIIETARPDGMVYLGYNLRDKKWEDKGIIVDVGFTSGLFARLYDLTYDNRYLNFLKKFIKRYIELFYMPSCNGFCTSIDKNNCQQGGMFGRGQAWALEGLIPAYKVLKDDIIKQVIDNTVENLINIQHKNGGWAYNLTKPLMGEDCKGISVIAKNLMDWYNVTHNGRIRQCAEKALDWCCKHTAIDGEAKGGIFSFCYEGAIVHNLCSSCAFVYASAYVIELDQMLKQ